MPLLMPWKWESDSKYTEEFELESSVTDFDEPYVTKNVYGIQVNTVTDANIPCSFNVYWRKNPKDTYTLWGSGGNDDNSLQENLIYYKKQNFGRGRGGVAKNIYNDAEPIRNVMTLQIKITATGWGEFAINDLNILFRPKRKWTATDVKTYIRAT